MNIFQFALRGLMRDLRSGELQMILLAIFIAVTALTTVGFFTDRVQRATEQQATELLAADLVLRTNKPLENELISSAHDLGLITTRTVSFRSVAVVGDYLQLGEIKAVESGYPIRGMLRTTDTLFGEEKITSELPGTGTVWVDARMLQNLGIDIGDTINLGSSGFTVARILTYEPDRGGDLFNIAPRVLMNLADLPATGLILPGSRASYRLLLGGEMDALEKFRQSLNLTERDGLRIQSIRDARPELKTALERAEQFLGLAVLISIALAGLAISMSTQRYVTRHFDHCAIMRCLGTTQNTILKIYLCQLFMLALLGSIPGCITGYIAQGALTSLMAGISQSALPGPGMLPLLQGLLTGLITVLGFSIPQLLRLKHVSPLRVLRRDMSPMPTSGITTYGLAILALAMLTPWQSGKISLTFYTLLGLILTAVLLILGARFLIYIIKRLRTRAGVAIRYGLANIARRSGQSTIQILGIGLGIMVMLLLTLVKTDLIGSWHNRLPEKTPNYFLINIQPDDVNGIKDFLRTHFKPGDEFSPIFYPMIRGRLTTINDQMVNPESYNDDRAQRLASREFNLSQTLTMPADNRLVQGQWWKEDETEALFSVEEGIAETLGIKLNDKLTYSIAGQAVSGRVSNLRWVEWDSFNVNFFVISNPGTFENHPATYITSFYLPLEDRQLLSHLVRTFPSVTVFDLDSILTEVRKIMDQVTRAIEFVFIFTLLAGLIVLAAALQTTHDERIRESAVLFALGANRRQITTSLLAEFICIGLIAGILAAFTATIAEIILAEFVFKMDIVINPWLWVVGPAACILIIVFAGLLGTRRVLSSPPLITLRQN